MTRTEIKTASAFTLKQRLAIIDHSTLPHQCYEAVLIKAELARRAG